MLRELVDRRAKGLWILLTYHDGDIEQFGSLNENLYIGKERFLIVH